MKEWKECTRCPLHETRRHVVIGSGSVPADVFLIGEAPGASEDLRGMPFVGPSGVILRSAVTKAMIGAGSLRFYVTNILGCRPPKNREPRKEEIDECLPRVEQLIKAVRPRLVVFLGVIARHAAHIVPSGTTSLKLLHPAYILRCGGEDSTEYRHFYLELEEAFKKVKIKGTKHGSE